MKQNTEETKGTKGTEARNFFLQKKIGDKYLVDLSKLAELHNIALSDEQTLKIIKVKKVMFRQINDIEGVCKYVKKDTEVKNGKLTKAFFNGVWIPTSYKALDFLTNAKPFPDGINEDDEKFVNLQINQHGTPQQLTDSIKIPMSIIKMDIDTKKDFIYKFNAIVKITEKNALTDFINSEEKNDRITF